MWSSMEDLDHFNKLFELSFFNAPYSMSGLILLILGSCLFPRWQ